MPVTYSAPTVYRPSPQKPQSPSRKVPYLPALDGLRALAVAAVLVYHGELGVMPGGFLGVEVFFVISGYLITLLLMSEHQRMGRISLRRFWLRRARRLLPALYCLLMAVAIVTALFLRDEMAKMRGDFLAAFTYTTNWYLIATGSSYFDNLGQPSLLRHLWSLAVEEQFYILWPIIVAVTLRVCRNRLDRIASIFVSMAVASTVLMALTYDAADPSRAYYGTDTRAAGLILGATLALFWRPGHLARGKIGERGPLVDVIGVAGLAMLTVFCLKVTDQSPWLYRGGFFVVALASLAVIAAAAHPHSLLAPVLGLGLLRWIGTRSYGIYLWHWPVFVLTEPDGVDVNLSPGPDFVLRCAITLALTELTFRLVETPVRKGALGAWFRGLRARNPVQRRRRLRVTAWATAVMVLVIGMLGFAMATAKPSVNDIQQSIQAGEVAAASQTSAAAGAAAPGDTATTVPTTGASDTAAATTAAPGVTDPATVTAPATSAPAPAAPTAAPPTAAPAAAIHAIAIGDSVMLGAFNPLKDVLGPDSYIDAKVSRQFSVAVGIVDALAADGRLGQIVIIHLGNNGTVRGSDMDHILTVLKDVPRVIIVNVHVPRSWQDPNNATLAEHAAQFPNVRMVDWSSNANAHPEFFYSDNIHLKPPGAAFYAQLIAQAIA